MSAALMGAVWKLKLTHGQQVVMLALADHAHDDGTRCYPGVSYLAWKTGYSERNVIRILGELESLEIIEPQSKKRGGAGNVTEYHIHIEKGDKKDEYNPDKSHKRVTNETKKGDKSDKNPDNSAQKGDKSDAGQYIHAGAVEPSGNHQEPLVEESESSRRNAEPLPDDDTGQCLLHLKKVKGIGKNFGELAVLVAELRAEFPNADPVEVCRDYEFNHRCGKEKTKVHASKLRNYFRTASKGKVNGQAKQSRPLSKAHKKRKVPAGYGRLVADEEVASAGQSLSGDRR
jgi:hypothetical protein